MEIRNNVSEILKKYMDNMDRQKELDKTLLTVQNKEDWIACLKNRAVKNQSMLEENNRLIHELDLFLQDPFDKEGAQLLFDSVHDMYMNGYDDCEVLLPIFYKLITYYEQNPCINNLLFLYGATYYEENEVRNRKQGLKINDESYNLKILEYKKLYSDLDDESRRRIWVAYYNLIVVGLGNKALSADESCHYLQESMHFWNSPQVQALDKDNEEIIPIIERIGMEWLIVEENIENASQETKEFFCRIAGETYSAQMKEKNSVYEINNEVYAAYLHSQVLAGKTDVDTIVDQYFSYYTEKLKSCPVSDEITDEDFYFIINSPLILERWLHFNISNEKTKLIMGTLKTATQTTWYQNFGKRVSSFLNEILAEWCFTLIKYLDSQDEKEEWLFQLLVRRQLPTYLHSVMVMHLAEAYFKEANRSQPRLFAGLQEQYGENLSVYVRQCALLHDIGKTKITDIVNTQGRRLSETEFQGIRMHPVYGAKMLDSDPDLSKYHDVVLGHHKFYDGMGGYPENFQNTKSDYRIIIDLITICDCIDAATDHLGRNYKLAKSLDSVIEELIAGKGHRYNPELVEILENSPGLQKEIRYIVSEGRLDIMYRAYLESVL